MVMGLQTMILNNKQRHQQRHQQRGSPDWWWLDVAHNNNNIDATRRSSPWLRSTLSELDEKTTAMLKLIEAEADSFAQRAEMYYKKRPDLVGVVEEFYQMHRSLAERFDQLKSDSATRLLTTLGSPFSCNGQVPLRKSISLSPGVYKNYDAYYSDMSDDHEDNPESEVEDPEVDGGIEPTSPKEESRGKPLALDEEALTRVDGNDEIRMLKEEIVRLKGENKTLRDEMARKDAESKEALGELSMSMYEIARLKEDNKFRRDKMACWVEQKVEMIREMTLLMDEKKRPMEQNKENKREATPPLNPALTDVPNQNDLSQKKVKQALPNLGKPGNTVNSDTTQGGKFLRRLFPKSSKKSKVTNALSFGTFS